MPPESCLLEVVRHQGRGALHQDGAGVRAISCSGVLQAKVDGIVWRHRRRNVIVHFYEGA